MELTFNSSLALPQSPLVRVQPSRSLNLAADRRESNSNAIYAVALGLMLAIGVPAGMAQQNSQAQISETPQPQVHAALPASSFAQLPSAPDPQVHLAMAAEESDASGFSSSAASAEPFAASMSFVPVRPAPRTRVIDGKYLTLNALHLGLAMFDVAMTQRCIASHQCREGNPLMPSSLAGQVSIDLSLVTYGSVLSYLEKKHNAHHWWIPPTAGIATHALGVTTGLMR
ncbi:MAG: hypothetical protein ABR928_16905 [Terracidiphilus sp.]|jgi:hypothetical protein